MVNLETLGLGLKLKLGLDLVLGLRLAEILFRSNVFFDQV